MWARMEELSTVTNPNIMCLSNYENPVRHTTKKAWNFYEMADMSKKYEHKHIGMTNVLSSLLQKQPFF